MPTDEQRKAIEEVLADRQEAIAAALIEEAETLVPVAVDSTLGELRRRTADKFTRQIVAASRRSRSPPTGRRSRRAGPISSSAWSTALGDGRASVTTRRTFKPWLADMATRDQEEILRIIGGGAARRHAPIPDRRELRATSTARSTTLSRRPHGGAETPDRRPGCDLPEDRRPLSRVHRRRRRCDATGTPRRDGKIYPIDKAPWLGNRTAGVSSSTLTTASRKKPPPWKNLTASP